MECSLKPEYRREVVQRVEVAAVGASGEQTDKKSRRQKGKELKKDKSKQPCHKFIESGTCRYGETCKFSHDIMSYEAEKPKPLGPCIFSHAAGGRHVCPYGMTCRFSHSDEGGGEGEGGVLEVGCSSDIDVKLAISSSPIQPPINNLPKEVQTKLWKGRYDFSRAESVLLSLGLRDSRALRGKGEGEGEGLEARPLLKEDKGVGKAGGGTGAFVNNYDEKEAKRQRTGNAPSDREPSGADAAVADAATAASTSDWIQQHVETFLRPEEKRRIDFRGKIYVAPLTTVGNLPFRRICKLMGADITIGEMALGTNLIQGQGSEWALVKRHPCEDLFGVQVAGGYPDTLSRIAQLIEENVVCDFVDLNMGCPIDLVCDRGAGSSLLLKPKRIEEITKAMSRAMDVPLTLKTRKGFHDGADVTHTFAPLVRSWGAQAFTLHGRTRAQRYSSFADWDYINRVAKLDPELQLIGNGDIFSFMDWNSHMMPNGETGPLATCMIGRGALIKPWLMTEIKEQRHWDISASERFDMIKRFVSFGLEHWGSDSRGVENCRRFLLEWLSYLCRYVPIGLLEVNSVPQNLGSRIPPCNGRNELETLLSSDHPSDWVKISTMLLGPPPVNFSFTPKHKSSSTNAVGYSNQAFEPQG